MPKEHLFEYLMRHDTAIVYNILHLDKSYTQGRTPVDSWSGSAWPDVWGGAAFRYANHREPVSHDFHVNYDAFRMSPAPMPNPSEEQRNAMSPAEKYDYLIGDKSWTLTRQMWLSGLKQIKDNGFVSTWAGYDGGWAKASVMESRPIFPVTVLAADGNPLTFYPDDIKALATVFWASPRNVGYLAGEACSSPSGRDSRCKPMNAGSWHIAVTNTIGRNSVLMFNRDSTGGIWNYPIRSYEYSYFRVSTGKKEAKIESAIEPLLSRDHRSRSAKYVVGIEMSVTYTAMTTPRRQARDSSDQDASPQHLTYRYDLELDESGRILGGTWQMEGKEQGPGYVFIPPRKPYAGEASVIKPILGTYWPPNSPPPFSWRAAAQWHSENEKMPLGQIVDSLIKRSKFPPQ